MAPLDFYHGHHASIESNAEARWLPAWSDWTNWNRDGHNYPSMEMRFAGGMKVVAEIDTGCPVHMLVRGGLLTDEVKAAFLWVAWEEILQDSEFEALGYNSPSPCLSVNGIPIEYDAGTREPRSREDVVCVHDAYGDWLPLSGGNRLLQVHEVRDWERYFDPKGSAPHRSVVIGRRLMSDFGITLVLAGKHQKTTVFHPRLEVRKDRTRTYWVTFICLRNCPEYDLPVRTTYELVKGLRSGTTCKRNLGLRGFMNLDGCYLFRCCRQDMAEQLRDELARKFDRAEVGVFPICERALLEQVRQALRDCPRSSGPPERRAADPK